MNKNTILKILIPIQGVLILSQVTTAYLHDSLSHEAFETVHIGGGTVLVLCVVAHVALNWSWVKASYFRKKKVG